MSSTYIGIWINWSHGPIIGSTLTLSQRDGGILIAFITLVVSTAGAAIWKISRYTLHQHHSKQTYQDGFHHQQQVILRNSESSVGSLLQMIQLTWCWRSIATKRLIRSIPLAGLALLNLLVFSITGIFSSVLIKTSGNEVLVRSPNCGLLTPIDSLYDTTSGQAAMTASKINDTLAATTYQRACYSDDRNLPQCNQFVQKQLPWTADQNSACPFASNMCLLGDTTAYKMDTGLIDSRFGLGINSPRRERIQYRKVTSCSPIQTKGYTTPANDFNPNSSIYDYTLIQFNYGKTNGTNYTHAYDTHDRFRVEDNSIGYQLMYVIEQSMHLCCTRRLTENVPDMFSVRVDSTPITLGSR